MDPLSRKRGYVRGALRGNVGICEPQGGEAGGLIHPRRLLPGAHLLPCAASAKGRFACYHRGCRCCRGRRERVRGAHRAGNNSRDPARANGAGSSSVSLAPFLLFLAPSCPLSPRGRSEEIEILHLWRSAALLILSSSRRASTTATWLKSSHQFQTISREKHSIKSEEHTSQPGLYEIPLATHIDVAGQ